ncbi:MAG: hypothetical protein M3R02_01965 [Chloroflexota bacterium]|nr:hypothetical protein [Chloroflexota bacterium]
MRRLTILLAFVTIALVGLLVAGRVPTVAQEGTPTGEEFGPPEGVTFEALALASGVDLPSPADVVVFRFGLEPGAGFPIDAADPSTGLVIVESGAFTFRIEAPITVTRAAAIRATSAAAGPFTPQTEVIPAGTEFTLEEGDSAFFPPNVPGELRNAGQERTVALVALIAPPEEAPGGTGTPVGATPAT